jgi:hypothetical protein
VKDIVEVYRLIVPEGRDVLVALLREAEERLNRGELGLEDVGGFLSRKGGLLVVTPVLPAGVLGFDVETAREVVEVLTDFSDFYVRGSGAVALLFDGERFYYILCYAGRDGRVRLMDIPMKKEDLEMYLKK